MRLSKISVGITFVISLLLAGLLLPVSAQTGPRTFTTSPSAAISEGSVTNSTITVPESGSITDLKVVVNITHSHSGDLRISLQHESTGTTVQLLRWLNGPGFAYGCGADGIVAIFDDAAGTPMDSYDCSSNFDGVVTGSWRPTNALSAFDGQDFSGRWTLSITDTVVSDSGILNSWGLAFNSDQPVDGGGSDGGGSDGGSSGGGSIDDVLGGTANIPLCVNYDAEIGNRRNDFVRTDNFDDMFGVYCRPIAQDSVYTRSAAEIGNVDVINEGVLHAVDVFTTNRTDVAGTQVCLRGTGNLVFLNADYSPRRVQLLPTTRQGGYACITLPAQGTLVMVGGGDTTATSTQPGRPTSVSAGVPLSGCRITTDYMINIRSAPTLDSTILDMVPYQTTLTATERTEDWFRVIYLNFQGWIAADYLTPAGTCSMPE